MMIVALRRFRNFIDAPKINAAICWIVLALVSAAEVITSAVHVQTGLILHTSVLIGLLAISALSRSESMRKLSLALVLAPLIRLLSLSLPLPDFPQIEWYPIVSIPLLVTLWLIVRQGRVSTREMGLRPGNLLVQLMIMGFGVGLGALEYSILQPAPLIRPFTWPALVSAALILTIFTGFSEEIIFRGLLQSLAIPVLGRWALIYVALLFGALHAGYLSVVDVVFVFAVGLLFAYIVYWGRSILGVTLAHGLTNIFLFLVMPIAAEDTGGTIRAAVSWATIGGSAMALVAIGILFWQARRDGRLTLLTQARRTGATGAFPAVAAPVPAADAPAAPSMSAPDLAWLEAALSQAPAPAPAAPAPAAAVPTVASAEVIPEREVVSPARPAVRPSLASRLRPFARAKAAAPAAQAQAPVAPAELAPEPVAPIAAPAAEAPLPAAPVVPASRPVVPVAPAAPVIPAMPASVAPIVPASIAKPAAAETEAPVDRWVALYRRLTEDTRAPLLHLQVETESPASLRASLFIPTAGAGARGATNRVQVFVDGVPAPELAAKLLPPHFRFVSGVVDIFTGAARQESGSRWFGGAARKPAALGVDARLIGRELSRRLTRELSTLADQRPIEFRAFWAEYGSYFESGIQTYEDRRNRWLSTGALGVAGV